MALLTVKNVSESPLHLGDFYTTIPPDGKITVARPADSLSNIPSLREAAGEGKVVVAVRFAPGEVPDEDPFAHPLDDQRRKVWEVH